MGCDIHIWAEVRENGKWKMKGPVDLNRNYNLFAILANVRNGRGFAGIKTGEGFNPISDPKGVPDDASPEYKEKVSDWDGDGHSHSFHTLKELQSFDWGQITMLRGTLSIEEYKEVRETGRKPRSYSGSVWGPRCVTLDTDDADKLLDGGVNSDVLVEQPTFYVNYHWPVMYSETCGDFNDFLIALEKVGDPNDVRIVFFFDN